MESGFLSLTSLNYYCSSEVSRNYAPLYGLLSRCDGALCRRSCCMLKGIQAAVSVLLQSDCKCLVIEFPGRKSAFVFIVELLLTSFRRNVFLINHSNARSQSKHSHRVAYKCGRGWSRDDTEFHLDSVFATENPFWSFFSYWSFFFIVTVCETRFNINCFEFSVKQNLNRNRNRLACP